MYFSLVVCTESLYKKAKEFFIKQWRSDLLDREQNSLIWAYLITQHMRNLWKKKFSFSEEVYSYEDLYFSTSHSGDLLVFAIDSKKIAVDIEYTHKRDDSLIQCVCIPNSTLTQRENFYLQRCAKECLVKFLNLTCREMQDMIVSSLITNHYFVANERTFDLVLMLRYMWKEYPIHLNLKDWKVLALLQDEEEWNS